VKRKFYLKPAKRNSFFFILIIISIFSFGCGKHKIDEDTLVKIYVENMIIHERYSYSADSLRVHSDLVFKKYNTTKQDYKAELQQYSDDSDMWESFFKKADAYLTELKSKNKIN